VIFVREATKSGREGGQKIDLRELFKARRERGMKKRNLKNVQLMINARTCPQPVRTTRRHQNRGPFNKSGLNREAKP